MEKASGNSWSDRNFPYYYCRDRRDFQPADADYRAGPLHCPDFSPYQRAKTMINLL